MFPKYNKIFTSGNLYPRGYIQHDKGSTIYKVISFPRLAWWQTHTETILIFFPGKIIMSIFNSKKGSHYVFMLIKKKLPYLCFMNFVLWNGKTTFRHCRDFILFKKAYCPQIDLQKFCISWSKQWMNFEGMRL